MASKKQLAALARGRRKVQSYVEAKVPLWMAQLTNLNEPKLDMLAKALGYFPTSPNAENKSKARTKVLKYLSSRVSREGYQPVIKFIRAVVPKLHTVPDSLFETEVGKHLYNQLYETFKDEHPEWSEQSIRRKAVSQIGSILSRNVISGERGSISGHTANIKYAMRLTKCTDYSWDKLKPYQQKIIEPYMAADKSAVDEERVVDFVPLTKQYKLEDTPFINDLLHIHGLSREQATTYFKRVKDLTSELTVDTKNGVSFDKNSQVMSNAAWHFNPEKVGESNWYHKDLIHPQLCRCGGQQELIIFDRETYTKKWECRKCKRRHIQQMPFKAIAEKTHIEAFKGRIIAPTRIKAKKQSLKKYFYWINPYYETIHTTTPVEHNYQVRYDGMPVYLERFKELAHIPTAHLYSHKVLRKCKCDNGWLTSPLPVMFTHQLRYIPTNATHKLSTIGIRKWNKLGQHIAHYMERHRCLKCDKGYIETTMYTPLPDCYEPSTYVRRLSNKSTTSVGGLYMKREVLREARGQIDNESEHAQIAKMINGFIDEYEVDLPMLNHESDTFLKDFYKALEVMYKLFKINIKQNRVPISTRDLADLRGFKGDRDNLTRSFFKFTSKLGNITNYSFVNKGIFGKVHMRTKSNESRFSYLFKLAPVIRWYKEQVRVWKAKKKAADAHGKLVLKYNKPLDYMKEACIDLKGKVLRIKTALPIKRIVLEGLYTQRDLDDIDNSQIIKQVWDDVFTKGELEEIGIDLAKNGCLDYIYRLKFFKVTQNTLPIMNNIVMKMAIAGIKTYDIYSEDKVEEKKIFFNGTTDQERTAKFVGLGYVLDEYGKITQVRKGGDYFIGLVPRYCDNVVIASA